MIVIIAVMFVIVAAAAVVFALVASTQKDEPRLRFQAAERLAERLGMRRTEERGSLRVIATSPRSTAPPD